MSTELYDLDFGEPSPELLEWAKENINEDPDTRCQVISDFRDMIYERGECTPHRTDDLFLLRFLRARGFVKERAHRLLVNYYDFKENNPEIFRIDDYEHQKKIADDDVISTPPYREGSGRRILVYRLGRWNPERFTIQNIFQSTIFMLEAGLIEQRAQILGGIALFDFQDMSMQQAWHFTPSMAHTVIQIMVTSFPMKIEAVHIVNQSYVFDVTYNLFKSFLNEKMRSRIFFHGSDMESLHKHIDPKHLPERYGGVHKDYNYKDWIKICKKIPHFRSEMLSFGYSDYQDSSDEEENDGEIKK